MHSTNARIRCSAWTRAFVLLLHALLLAFDARAAEIPLPAATVATLTAACPDCVTEGFFACGSPDVAWGRRFTTTALLGTPKRAYLLTATTTGDEFRRLARNTAYPTLIPMLRRRFARTRLVILEDGLRDPRLIDKPGEIRVTFPRPLHTCLYGSPRPWGCCVGTCKDDECCEKALGSPTVEVLWKDGDETLTLHYSHTIGLTWLDRRTTTTTRYACLTDTKGKLRSSDAPLQN